MHIFRLSTIFFSLASASVASRAPNFAITASLPPNSPLSIAQGWNLTSYHISPCYDYAVFTNATGRTFYANGTASEFNSHTSNILSDGGTPPWPWGTIISAANATDNQGRRNVFINCGDGTPGLEVVSGWGNYGSRGDSGSVVYGTGEFYVCNSTLLYGPAITLYYKEEKKETPEGCTDVELRTRCLDDETMHEFQRDSWCSWDE